MKEDRKKAEKPAQKAEDGISKRGKKILAFGIVEYVLAFVVLAMVNSEATNWASVLSPIMFVSSFIIISLGIIAK